MSGVKRFGLVFRKDTDAEYCSALDIDALVEEAVKNIERIRLA